MSKKERGSKPRFELPRFSGRHGLGLGLDVPALDARRADLLEVIRVNEADTVGNLERDLPVLAEVADLIAQRAKTLGHATGRQVVFNVHG